MQTFFVFLIFKLIRNCFYGSKKSEKKYILLFVVLDILYLRGEGMNFFYMRKSFSTKISPLHFYLSNPKINTFYSSLTGKLLLRCVETENLFKLRKFLFWFEDTIEYQLLEHHEAVASFRRNSEPLLRCF